MFSPTCEGQRLCNTKRCTANKRTIFYSTYITLFFAGMVSLTKVLVWIIIMVAPRRLHFVNLKIRSWAFQTSLLHLWPRSVESENKLSRQLWYIASIVLERERRIAPHYSGQGSYFQLKTITKNIGHAALWIFETKKAVTPRKEPNLERTPDASQFLSCISLNAVFDMEETESSNWTRTPPTCQISSFATMNNPKQKIWTRINNSIPGLTTG